MRGRRSALLASGSRSIAIDLTYELYGTQGSVITRGRTCGFGCEATIVPGGGPKAFVGGLDTSYGHLYEGGGSGCHWRPQELGSRCGQLTTGRVPRGDCAGETYWFSLWSASGHRCVVRLPPHTGASSAALRPSGLLLRSRDADVSFRTIICGGQNYLGIRNSASGRGANTIAG